MCYLGVLLHRAALLQNSWQLGDGLAPSLIFHEIQMIFHGDVCSLVFANQKENILVGRFFFFPLSLSFWETIPWGEFDFREKKKNETKNKNFKNASVCVTRLHDTVMEARKALLVLWTKKSWARPSQVGLWLDSARGASVVLPFHSAIIVPRSMASCPQDGCFTSSTTSASLAQRKSEGKAEGRVVPVLEQLSLALQQNAS